jgi:hypothetical protein
VGDTLTTIARKHGYRNPGPIVAFNAERLPFAVESVGAARRLTETYKASNSVMQAA